MSDQITLSSLDLAALLVFAGVSRPDQPGRCDREWAGSARGIEGRRDQDLCARSDQEERPRRRRRGCSSAGSRSARRDRRVRRSILAMPARWRRASSRTTRSSWPGTCRAVMLPKNRVKLALNLLLIGIQAIPRGGTLAVDPVGEGETIGLSRHRNWPQRARAAGCQPNCSAAVKPATRSTPMPSSPTTRDCWRVIAG